MMRNFFGLFLLVWAAAASATATTVSLSASPTSKTGTPSTTVPYSVTVTNFANATDSFTLNVSSIVDLGGQPNWTPSVVGSANNVTSLGTASITVNVAIPAAARAHQFSVTRVMATSQANGSSYFVDLITFAESTLTDFNADGKSDILYRNFTTGQVFLIGMNGLGSIGHGMVYQEPNTAWKIVANADFNGDQVNDLLWRNSTTGEVYLMPFASGIVAEGQGRVIYTEPNPAWQIVLTPDLNGDGNADIVWWNSVTGQVYAMLMNGTTIIAQGMLYTEPNTQWRIVAAGDFSGNNKENQLVWRHGVTGEVYMMTVGIFASGGTLTALAPGSVVYTEPNPAWKIVAAVDFNGDGASDLLWRNDATGQVAILLMDGGTILGGGIFYTEHDLAWKIVAVGDYNGDGKADILWRNETTGQVYMMLMNGTTIASQGVVYSEPNTDWKVLGPYEYSQQASAAVICPARAVAGAYTGNSTKFIGIDRGTTVTYSLPVYTAPARVIEFLSIQSTASQADLTAEFSISECPGDFNTMPAECKTWGTVNTSGTQLDAITWPNQYPGACTMITGKPYYLNVRNTRFDKVTPACIVQTCYMNVQLNSY